MWRWCRLFSKKEQEKFDAFVQETSKRQQNI
jgi:hypothetical protein